jgi:CheY-like chemotaxis protein
MNMEDSKAKILVVEDDTNNAMIIQKILLDSGYEITSIVDSGEEALVTVREQKPDLILMDTILKGKMTGVDASRIISQYFNIPIIYLTTSISDDLLADTRCRESYGFLMKPFTPNELNIAIDMAFINRGSEANFFAQHK